MRSTISKSFLLCTIFSFMSNAILNAQIKVEAENYSETSSLSTKIILENDGKTVGYFDEEGESMTYEVTIPEDGLYQMSFKYLTGKEGSIKIEDDNNNYFIFQTEANFAEEWWNVALNDWPVYDINNGGRFSLKAGSQKIKVINMGISINIDYFELTKSSSTDNEIVKITTSPSKLELMPNEKTSLLAYGYNANNELIATNIGWSSNATDGKYTAGSSEGSDVITVTMGNVSKDVKVKIAKPTKKQEFAVTKNGKLQTKNGAVCNEQGDKLSLMGPSFFWSCSAPLWWKAETVDYLVSQFNVQLIRLPVSIAPGDNTWDNPDNTWNTDNYLHSPEYTKELVDNMVRAAIENDIYVIIDFHEHYAHKWTNLSKEFFTYFSEKWGEYPNVMYEIYNEPITGNSDVITYAKEIIPVIRAIDNDNIIIVGSTQYSREPHNVTSAGEGYSNIAYTWHGYVEWGHQSDWNSNSSWNNGVPIVVTEWGVNWSKNDGGLINIYKEKKVINAFWSMSNKGGDDAKWSILKNDCYKTTGWTDSDMTENGAYLLGVAKTWVNYTPVLLSNSQELSLSISADQTFYLPKTETTLIGEATGGSENYTYTWSQVSGNSSAQIVSSNAASTVVNNLSEGTYIFRLTVNDGEDELEKTVKLTVYPEGYVDPSIIDNIDDNDIISLWGGNWKSFDDSNKNANPYSAITASSDLASDGVIKVDFTMGNQWEGEGWMGAPYCGVDLFMKANETAYDLSDCSSITYKYKGAAHEFRVGMTAVTDDDFHSVNISESSEWTTATINWSSLKQATDWGTDMDLDKSDIYKFSWQFKEAVGSTETLLIDDVACIGASAPTSVEETNITENDFFIAPNPAIGGQSSIYVSSICEVSVVDIVGNEILKFKAIPYFSNKINIETPGLYIVKIGNKTSKLIIK